MAFSMRGVEAPVCTDWKSICDPSAPVDGHPTSTRAVPTRTTLFLDHAGNRDAVGALVDELGQGQLAARVRPTLAEVPHFYLQEHRDPYASAAGGPHCCPGLHEMRSRRSAS